MSRIELCLSSYIRRKTTSGCAYKRPERSTERPRSGRRHAKKDRQKGPQERRTHARHAGPTGRTERPCADGRQDGRQGRQDATPERPQDGRTGCAYTHDGRQARHDGRHAGRPTPLARAMMEETQKAVSERPPQRHAGRTAGTIAGRKASCAGTDARQDGTTLKAAPHIVRNATPDGRNDLPERPTQGSSTHGRTARKASCAGSATARPLKRGSATALKPSK